VNNIKIALAGNPNSGKTTLFNALTGAHRKVGNYPGVTVEKLEGVVQRGDRRYHFVDLPGIYSLTAYSIDEVVTRDFIINEKPDVIVDVMDSTNLERNLYLCLQFQELRIPVVGALNMTDEAEAKGIRIDEQSLAASLGIPMVKTVGPKGMGMEVLLDRVDKIIDGKTENGVHMVNYGSEIEDKLEPLQKLIAGDAVFAERYPPRWLAVKLLEKDTAAFKQLEGHKNAARIVDAAQESALWIGKHFGRDAEIVISEQRYGYIRGATRESVKIVKQSDFSLTERIDRVIMNGLLALPIFILILWGIFQITFAVSEYPMAWLEAFFSFLSESLTNVLPDNLFRSLLVDGVIGGVGGVLSFVPQVVILFFFLSILEDVGYMARAAFATDKFLHSIGLHGQSVFPMMLGFGCSVPAIMASRTLKNPRDRILTVLLTPFMSCGAKLPVHVLLAAALFSENQANMVILIYAIGVVLALISAFILRRTVLKGDPTPFVMELPPYRAPTLRGVLWHVWEKTWFYIKKAGTIILAISIIIWVITTFPRYEASDAEREGFAATFYAENPLTDGGDEEYEEMLSQYVETVEVQLALENSFAGKLGHFIEPIFRPLGFDWKLATAGITGFAAKEVIVSTLGILYRVGAEEDEESEGLRESIASDPNMTPLVAFVFMLFVLIIPPCIAALGTMKAEIGLKWTAFQITFTTILGWSLSAIVFQIGSLLIH
jgi:ferrous iron transport protein B